MEKIITSYEMTCLPVRWADWTAVYEDYDGAPDSNHPIGHGATEAIAIQDLLDNTHDER